jgi:myo-inositol 2-dehydrogenase/D-chiro-inositol 1-dehydrogenase
MIAGIRAAIVGCGRMGAERARQAAAAGAIVAYCADTDNDRAQALAARFGSIALAEARAIPWRDVQAIFVCTPPSLRSIALDAIANGVAVFVEKPIGLTKDDGSVLADAVTKKPVINAVGYMNRYRPSVNAARQAAASSTVAMVSAYWASKRYAVPWWELPDLSGGPFNEQATHLVDLCRYVVGEIAEVRALAGPGGDGKRIARAAVAMRFEDGAVGALAYTCEANDKHIGLHIVTDAGAIELRGWSFSPAGSSDEPEPDAFALETRAFLASVSGADARLILSDFADATKTQSAVDAVRLAFSATADEKSMA